VDVADEREQGRRGQDADARYAHQEQRRGHVLREARQLVVERLGLGLEDRDFLQDRGEGEAQVARQAVVGQRRPRAGEHLGGTGGEGDAEFA
jgi:hypothetical protein